VDFRETRRHTPEQLLSISFSLMTCEQSLKILCPIFPVGQRSISQKNLTHLREAAIFILRYLYQSLLQLSDRSRALDMLFIDCFSLDRTQTLSSCETGDATGEPRVSFRWGSTANQVSEPTAHNTAATRNDGPQPKCFATNGVNDAVIALPI